ncbi:hypothetical protein Pelo_5422 [Pelomyxa schiedti]|nr:hypothetical protein Pelo_5422 [Pelomyxa schiedti]
MVTHPRCGCKWNRMLMTASSLSAENFANWGLVVRLVWGWVVGGGGPVKFFSVSVRDVVANGKSTLLTFGMSMLTLGIVSKYSRWWQTNKQGSGCVETIPAANKTHVIYRMSNEKEYNITYSRRSVGLETVRCAGGLRVWSGKSIAECVNHKWLVFTHLFMKRKEFAVANLLLEHPTARVLPSQMFTPIDIFMNKMKEDEAVLVKKRRRYHKLRIAVVNIQDVWSGRTCSPIFQEEYCFPSSIPDVHCYYMPTVLILQAHSERCFIVQTTAAIIQYNESADPHEVHSANYDYLQGGGLALTQLSERLYCVTSTPNTLEIWDCNNPANALRIVDNQFCCRIVYAHCGLLFHVGGNRVTVTDYSSGSKVATLHVNTLREGNNHPTIDTLSSFCCWIGEIAVRQGIRAQHQFAALLVASQCCRCGGKSHAGVLGPALAKQLWDTWVIGTERKLAVVVQQKLSTLADATKSCVIRFGVSLALMGLTTEVQVARESCLWATGDMLLEPVHMGGPVHILKNVVSGKETRLEVETHYRTTWCINGTWLVQPSVDGKALVVTEVQNEEGAVVHVPLPENYHITESLNFNKMCSSQVVMLMTMDNSHSRSSLLAVVDITSSYATKVLQIVSSTQCAFSQRNSVKAIYLMKNQADQNVYIVETSAQDIDGNVAHIVLAVESNGMISELRREYRGWWRAEEPLFGQLSGSLFTLSDLHGGMEIWDCSCTASFTRHSPLRKFTPTTTLPVLVGGGLILFIDDHHQLQVVEGTSGFCVASIGLLPDFHLNAMWSFLW